MKKITRFLCVAVSVFILFTALPYSVSAKLSDISGTTNEKIITRWHEAGLISGYPDGTFKSEVYITRAQFAKIISDLFVLDGETVKYEDVSENDWYYPYVNRVSEYMTCYKSDASENCNELFMPDEKIDMTQAVEILSKLTKVPDEIKQNVKEFATREDLVVLLDNLLGGEPGFSYMLSVIDAHKIENDEILPLTELTKESESATWNEKGQVLLLSWHSYPDSYVPGEQFTCKYGEMWTFTDKEILSWYDKNGEGVVDWELRLEQLLGLPATDKKTHVSAFWVDTNEIIRPAYQTDISKQIDISLLDGSMLNEYKEWFDGNAEYSYEISAYPWTRLGYTYDWSESETEYGLTEFIILPDSVIDVEWTMSLEEFLTWMKNN